MKHFFFALVCALPAWAGFQVAPFSTEVTVPMGHALMGGGIMAAHHVVDPLYARGVVLIGGEKPLVFLSVDWCEIRNDAYDRFRDVVAEAAGTARDHVMISSVHVHDAPVIDFTAQKFLDEQNLPKALCDSAWAEKQFQNVALAVRDAVKTARNVTHYGIGQAEVKELASNRRCVMPDGSVNYSRTSATGDENLRACDVGEHDPILRTLSFWDGDKPVAALHAYAIHPMSYYGKGGVSADFVGMARRVRESEMPDVLQVYFSGCSGDVVAGKWNDGNFNNKPLLAEKLHVAMVEAWDKTEKFPLEKADLKIAMMNLAPKDFGGYSVVDSEKEIANKDEKTFKRILAAMNLSWRKRIAAGQPIEVPAVNFGKAQFLLMPAESFVGYQLMAQKLDPEQFVFTAGYGECAPGYIPTAFASGEHFNEQQDWCWVDQTAEGSMKNAMAEALGVAK